MSEQQEQPEPPVGSQISPTEPAEDRPLERAADEPGAGGYGESAERQLEDEEPPAA